MDTRHIHIADFNYPLPDERIAKFPVLHRDSSKLLVYRHGDIAEDRFFNITKHLPTDSLMVFNNTRVIQARLHFHKPTGAQIEIFLLDPAEPSDYEQVFRTTSQCMWRCLVGNLKKWKGGTLTAPFNYKGQTVTMRAMLDDSPSADPIVRFEWDNSSLSFAEILDIAGELPIPPYLNRATEESDKQTYQTVYSKIKGSVAAPTAGLHFTNRELEELSAHGIEREEVTLHVGAGTFKPVKTATIGNHSMHTEFFSVRRTMLERLLHYDAKAIAVGTTSVRTLESLYYIGSKLQRQPRLDESELGVQQWEPYDENTAECITPRQAIENILRYMERHAIDTLHSGTQIMIAPGYDYKIVKALVTNFHQPQSTLLLLVSAFVHGDWRRIYDYALEHDFRFLSYGDSSLLIP